MRFKIKKKALNDLFFKIYEAHSSQYKRITINYGGAGSGKSVAQAQFLIVRALTQKIAVLVLRQCESSHTLSTWSLIKSQLEKAGINYTTHETNKIITLTDSGSVFYFKGCDKVDKLKSLSFPNGCKEIHCWIEEADQIAEYDSEQINLRFRGKDYEDKIYFYYTFNPTDKTHWIYKTFFERERKDCLFFHSTYKDNKFLDRGYIATIESYQTYSPQMWAIYGLGEFGNLISGMECYHKFDSVINEKLQKDYFYDENATIYLSFDENVNPYVTLLVAQKFENRLVVIDEICIKGKNLEETCKEFSKKYFEHKAMVVVTGDPSSKKQDSKLEKGVNFFTLVLDYLSDFNPVLRVDSKAQNVYLRILFGNKLLHENRIIVKQNCKLTINDMQAVKWNSAGDEKNKAIEVIANSDGTKTRAQKAGHQTDALEYLFCQMFKSELATFRNRGQVSKMIIDHHESNDY